MQPDNLNAIEAADYLRTTPSALYSQRHRRELPGRLGVKVGAKLLFRRSDLDRYLDDLVRAQEAQVSP